MKQTARAKVTCVFTMLVILWLSVFFPSNARASFALSDLGGTWYLFGYRDLPSSNDPAWTNGTLILSSTGFVNAGGILFDNIGFPVAVSSGSLFLTAGGLLSGSITAGGITLNISQGQMSTDKTTAAFVGSDSQNFRFDGNLIKAQGTFSPAELAGTWHVFMLGDDGSVWNSGTVTIDNTGNVTGGNFFDSNGQTKLADGGAFSRNSSGVIVGSFSFSTGVTNNLTWGKMDPDKNSIAFVGTDSQGFRIEGDMIKSGGTFSLSDLAGKWNIVTFEDLPSSNNPRWENAKVTIDASGAVRSGTFVDSEGSSRLITGGTLFISPDGLISGSITGGGVTFTIPQGKIDLTKATASFVGTDSQNFRILGTAVKLEITQAALNDFDGDGKADFGIYRSGAWSILRSSDGGNTIVGWGGGPEDVPVHADYDGDGIMDIAIYRAGAWSIKNSFDGSNTIVGWGGGAQDILVPADYDGDKKADIAIYRSGVWSILRSSDGGNTIIGFGGSPGDIPVPADYDGDGKTDVAVYRAGTWFILRSSDGVITTVTVTSPVSDDVPIPGDYDGDGKADAAIYRKNGTWFIRRSSDGLLDGFFTVGIMGGTPQDIPVTGDYNGDGRADIGVYRSSNGQWSIRFSSNQGFAGGKGAIWGGAPQDIPLN